MCLPPTDLSNTRLPKYTGMSVTISMKVPEELADRIEDAREDGESTSACLRRVTREGLDARERNPHAVTLPILLFWFGSVAVASQYVDATGAVGPAGFAMIVVGFYLYSGDRHERVSAAIARYTDTQGTTDSTEDSGTANETE